MLLKDEEYSPYVAPAVESIPQERVMTQEQALAFMRAKGYINQDEPA